tara:strand:- start:809 stop:1822 length:1014 start_codon:yes stop_codon:yes gene_type:complete
MGGGTVTDQEILETITNVQDAIEILDFIDQKAVDDTPPETLIPVSDWAKTKENRNSEYWNIAHLVEDELGYLRPWVGLVVRAVEYWELFLPAENDLQENLIRSLQQNEVDKVRQIQAEAAASAWKCLVNQLSRHLPTEAQQAARVGSLCTVPHVSSLFGPPPFLGDTHPLLNGDDTKKMHLPTVVLAMLWVHPGTPLWLASVPVSAEIVRRFLSAFDYRFDVRLKAVDFEHGFERVCAERIRKNQLRKGFSQAPLIKKINRKPPPNSKFDGYQFRSGIETTKILKMGVAEPPLFNDGGRAAVIEKALKDTSLASKERIELVKLYPKYDSIFRSKSES